MSRSSPRGVGLPDVNVLVAAAWPNHVGHAAARAWFAAHGTAWATTPVTESGFVRVSSNRAALPTSTTPRLAIEMLHRLCDLPGHAFWEDSVRAVTGATSLAERLRGHRQVTDAHLLALCAAHRGHLVTFDAAMAVLAEHPFQVRLLTVAA